MSDPQARDSATLWIMDGEGEIALPRVTIDAIGKNWDAAWVQLNLVDRQRRTLRLWSKELGDLVDLAFRSGRKWRRCPD